MSVTIRSFEATDAAVVKPLFIEALRTVYPTIGAGEWTSDLDNVRQFYQANGGAFLVAEAEANGEIVGEGGIHRVDDTTAEMKRVAVSPDFQEGGIGQKMVAALESRARELGFSKMVLDTTLGQAAARHIYEKAGYELVDRKDVDHPSGVTFDTFFYEKDLRDAGSESPNPELTKPKPEVPQLVPLAHLWSQAHEVPAGEYRLLQGSDEPAQIRPGQIYVITEGPSSPDILPGVHNRGVYNSEGIGSRQGENEQILSFLYHKHDSEGKLEVTERAIIFRGIGYGMRPGHAGQEPTWYLVGPQLGTIDPETRQAIGFPDSDIEIPAKHFSISCITDGPLGEPVLANLQ